VLVRSGGEGCGMRKPTRLWLLIPIATLTATLLLFWWRLPQAETSAASEPVAVSMSISAPTATVPESAIKPHETTVAEMPVGSEMCVLHRQITSERHVWIDGTDFAWSCDSAVTMWIVREADGYVAHMDGKRFEPSKSSDQQLWKLGYIMAVRVEDAQ
jgi:hypothetical protein